MGEIGLSADWRLHLILNILNNFLDAWNFKITFNF